MASDVNRTEWSSIKSVTVQVSSEIGQAGSENPTCYQSIIKDNWMKQSCYQLIKTMAKFQTQINF